MNENTNTEREMIECASSDCVTRFYFVPARGKRASYCLDCADDIFGPERGHAASFERVADELDGTTLPELDDETIEAELIEQERFEREQRIADVRRFYGDEAAELVFDGWTLDSAISHVEGTCDVVLCTHPSHDTDEHTVDISDVRGESMRVAARDVRQGDVVFDVFGGEHVVARVVHFKRMTRIVRDDRATTTLPSASTITIKRRS